jgi:AcrR family transcriptional regulator
MVQSIAEPRQRLIDAAIAVFGECGFRGATTRRIADAAGVNEVTIFRLFGSKSALLEEAVRQSEARTAKPSHAELPDEPGDPEAELEVWARDHWRAMRERRSVIRKMMSEMEEHPEISACMTEGWDRMRNNLLRYVQKLHDRGALDADAPVPTAVTMFTGTLFADAMGRDIKRNVYSPERQAIMEYTRLFLRALGYAPARAVNIAQG